MSRGASKNSSMNRLMKPAWTLALLLLFCAFEFQASAEATILSLQPQASRIMGTDEEFKINLAVADVQDLYGWQMKLYFDSGLLTVVSIVEGSFLKNGGDTYFINSPGDGNLTAACTLVGNVSGVAGSGLLATIVFRTKTLGNSLLTLSNTKLGDSTGGPIPHITANGAVEVVPPIRDVAVRNVALSRNEVGEGRSVKISVLTANEGSRSEDFTINLYRNDTVIGTVDVLNLTAGAVRTLVYVWDTTGLPMNSSYQVKAEALPVPDEADLSDNVFVDGFLKITQGEHDVAISTITPQYSTVYEGRKVNVTVVAANKGDFSETFTVTLYYNDIVVATESVLNLPYGEERKLDFVWDTTGVASNRSYIIKATASYVQGEANLQDNTLVDGSITVLPRALVSLNIVSVIPSDQYGVPLSDFARGSIANFKVTINCSSLIPEFLLLTVNVYDASNKSIAVISFRGLVAPGSTTFVLGSVIPVTSPIGNAVVYADALRDWPHLGGTPYCPERSATFQVRGP